MLGGRNHTVGKNMDPNVIFMAACAVFPPLGYFFVASALVLEAPDRSVSILFLAGIPSIIGTLIWVRISGVRALASVTVISAILAGLVWHKIAAKKIAEAEPPVPSSPAASRTPIGKGSGDVARPISDDELAAEIRANMPGWKPRPELRPSPPN
jgi:hypothetical protein